jgi:hypothetical protein
MLSLPLVAVCFIIFVQSGCRFEFGSSGGWLACKNAIGTYIFIFVRSLEQVFDVCLL